MKTNTNYHQHLQENLALVFFNQALGKGKTIEDIILDAEQELYILQDTLADKTERSHCKTVAQVEACYFVYNLKQLHEKIEFYEYVIGHAREYLDYLRVFGSRLHLIGEIFNRLPLIQQDKKAT